MCLEVLWRFASSPSETFTHPRGQKQENEENQKGDRKVPEINVAPAPPEARDPEALTATLRSVTTNSVNGLSPNRFIQDGDRLSFKKVSLATFSPGNRGIF